METRESRHAKFKKVKKKRLNIARTLVLVLFIYIIVCVGVYIYQEPVRHYEIIGNEHISDIDIIRDLSLENYPSFVSINTKSLKKTLEDNVLIKKASVKYSWNFSLVIEIEENSPIFVYKALDKICLSDGTLIDYSKENAVGIPILLNSTPEEQMKTLAQNLSNLDSGILYLINDIEYRPSYNSSNQVIDDYRFLLSMNDKNMVYVNAKKLKSMNKYLEVIATNKLVSSGTFFLDGTEDRYPFILRTDDPNTIVTTTTTKVIDDVIDDAPIGDEHEN